MGARQFDDDRVLCVDGGCIGLVGSNGRCKECGKPGPKGAVAKEKSGKSIAGDDDDDDDSNPPIQKGWEDDHHDDDHDDDDDLPDATSLPPGDPDFDDRVLCPDGACVGLIGPSGRCGVCGKREGEEE